MREKLEDITPKQMKKAIKNVLTHVADTFESELFVLKKEELERRWFFKFNPTLSIAENLYKFHDLLNLYGCSCRRWEEHHNGSCCVVERVRDQYLMPKIKAFVDSALQRGDEYRTN